MPEQYELLNPSHTEQNPEWWMNCTIAIADVLGCEPGEVTQESVDRIIEEASYMRYMFPVNEYFYMHGRDLSPNA